MNKKIHGETPICTIKPSAMKLSILGPSLILKLFLMSQIVIDFSQLKVTRYFSQLAAPK
jgi:hypothetical protein